MSINDRVIENIVYRRAAPLLLVLSFVIAIVAAAGTYANDRAISKANTERIADQAHLLRCFDEFATSLAGGLPPVREATVRRDDARVAWEAANSEVARAIEAALAHVASTGADGSQLAAILSAFHDLDAASVRLDRANAHLTQVREDNPYPPPPSEFCNGS